MMLNVIVFSPYFTFPFLTLSLSLSHSLTILSCSTQHPKLYYNYDELTIGLIITTKLKFNRQQNKNYFYLKYPHTYIYKENQKSKTTKNYSIMNFCDKIKLMKQTNKKNLKIKIECKSKCKNGLYYEKKSKKFA